MTRYFRPLVASGPRPKDALPLAGGPLWFNHVVALERGKAPAVLPVFDLPSDWHEALTKPRAPVMGLSMQTPQIMGILNVTPDSFSDGGRFDALDPAIAQARAMHAAGVTILDVGGESTRPGAQAVDSEEESARVAPVVIALREAVPQALLSLDTRKAGVARGLGIDMINDVSGFTYDPELAAVAAQSNLPVCVMHSQGTPDTMQQDPQYANVLLDVFDWLKARIEWLEAQGIPRSRIVADPGIGFGKTLDHTQALLSGIALFHGLGVPLLLGVSRKGFIGRVAQADDPQERMPGSVAVGLAALGQGVQILRVHDVAAHAQAIALWRFCMA